MKTLVIFAALFGTLLATDNVNVNNEDNAGGNTHQTVNINNHDQVANVNNLNGWNSWDSVCDYGRGIFATRLYGKKMCVVTKIDKTVFPSLDVLSKVSQQKPVMTTTQFKINPNKVPIANIGIYGVHVEALCRGIPSYSTDVIQVDEYYKCDINSIITIGGISFCF
ncbi:gastrokine-1-like [Hyla sarda]|uniref:gastrokine-1-like n=1 Tax=Hyla sarda TaxID=327740 RepID=UPI0024C43670|nr:gastrokine-1-like [Hyla sarda]